MAQLGASTSLSQRLVEISSFCNQCSVCYCYVYVVVAISIFSQIIIAEVNTISIHSLSTSRKIKQADFILTHIAIICHCHYSSLSIFHFHKICMYRVQIPKVKIIAFCCASIEAKSRASIPIATANATTYQALHQE